MSKCGRPWLETESPCQAEALPPSNHLDLSQMQVPSCHPHLATCGTQHLGNMLEVVEPARRCTPLSATSSLP
eukprot:3163250-Amphidinium_carterae.1